MSAPSADAPSSQAPSSRICIRPAVRADHSALVRWQIAMALETEERELNEARVSRGVEMALSDPAKGRYFVAALGAEDPTLAGRAIGGLLLTMEWSDWRAGWFWWIQSVYVEPEHRGRGVFKALYAAVLKQAHADPAVCGLRLYVEAENQRAQNCYARLGLQKTAYRLLEVEI